MSQVSQDYSITRLHHCRTKPLQDYTITTLHHYKITPLQHNSFTRLQIHIIPSQYYTITGLQLYKTTLSQNYTMTYRSPGSVWACHVAASVEMTKVFMCWLSVCGAKLVLELLCAHSVDRNGEVTVSDRSVPRLDRPHRFTERTHCSWRIEDDLGPVNPVHQPVERMVTTVADIDCQLSWKIVVNNQFISKVLINM